MQFNLLSKKVSDRPPRATSPCRLLLAVRTTPCTWCLLRIEPNCICVDIPFSELEISLDINLTLGYMKVMVTLTNAAALMGCRSAQVRTQLWGRVEFIRRMREWGKLGGRPSKPKQIAAAIDSRRKNQSRRGLSRGGAI